MTSRRVKETPQALEDKDPCTTGASCDFPFPSRAVSLSHNNMEATAEGSVQPLSMPEILRLILAALDRKTIHCAAMVSSCWRSVAGEVLRDQLIDNEAYQIDTQQLLVRRE